MFASRVPAVLLSILAVALPSAAQSDFASDRLLDIAAKEERIYKRLAEDPEFYSADDLERRVRELITAYRSYLVDNPDDPDALTLYGKLLRRIGDKEQAFEAFLKADSLDPDRAVVKQQIGTHLAEEGKGKAALSFYLQAADLEPETAAYHFGLGQLLLQFRDEFVGDGIFTRDALDRETLRAFRTAAGLEPDNFDLQMRLGEAFYDLASPDWRAALLHWQNLRKRFADSQVRAEILDLHRARCLVKLGRTEEARRLAEAVEHPSLQHSKRLLLEDAGRF